MTILPHPKRIHKPNLGFTLLEILVVFSVAVILAGVGFAGFVSYSRTQALDQATQEVKTVIDQTRFNAVSKVKPGNCGSNILKGYKFIMCQNVEGSSDACTTPSSQNNLRYEMRAYCGNQVVKVIKGKIQTSNLNFGSSSTCKTVYYNTLTGFDSLTKTNGVGGSCLVRIRQTDDASKSKDIVVDSAGNATIE